MSAVKKEEPKKAAKKEEPKKAVKKEEPKKPAKKEEPKKAPANKVYHISLREDDMWQVKFASGEKAIKLFKTQKEAIDYAKKLAGNQDGSIQIHKVDGKIRKQKY